MHKNSDNLYLNNSFAPCTMQKGPDIWQTDWPLSQGWKCSESLYENLPNPKLTKVSNFFPSCKVHGSGEILIASTLDSAVAGSKNVHCHHWIKKNNPTFFCHSQVCMYLSLTLLKLWLFLFHPYGQRELFLLFSLLTIWDDPCLTPSSHIIPALLVY